MKLTILDGNFYEGEYVTVAMGDDVVTRKVYYSTYAGDLYIRYKNAFYFGYEFENGYSGDGE